MRLLSGAALGACATLGLTVLVSSMMPVAPQWYDVAFATLSGAVAGILWQRNETRKEEDSKATINHLTSQLRKKGKV
jgi:membrane protein implicated in regulation of membrane protease activity